MTKMMKILCGGLDIKEDKMNKLILVVLLIFLLFSCSENIIKQSDYDAWDLSTEIISCDIIDKASGLVVLGNGGASKGYKFFVTKRVKPSFGYVIATMKVGEVEFLSNKVILESKGKAKLSGDELHIQVYNNWDSYILTEIEEMFKRRNNDR